MEVVIDGGEGLDTYGIWINRAAAIGSKEKRRALFPSARHRIHFDLPFTQLT